MPIVAAAKLAATAAGIAAPTPPTAPSTGTGCTLGGAPNNGDTPAAGSLIDWSRTGGTGESNTSRPAPARRVDRRDHGRFRPRLVAPPESTTASSGGTAAAHRAGTTAASTPRAQAANAVTTSTGTGTTNPVIPNRPIAPIAIRAMPIPTARPSTVPINANDVPSTSTSRRTWRRLAPDARSSPNSRRRSPTDSSRVFTTPTSACRSVNNSIHWMTRSNPRNRSALLLTNSSGGRTEVTPKLAASSSTESRTAGVSSDSVTRPAMSTDFGTWRLNTRRSTTASPSSTLPAE